jgi:hypothetical protein
MKTIFKLCVVLIVTTSLVTPAWSQIVGNTVRLSSTNSQGVPVHPAAGDSSYVRWANGTTGLVTAVDPVTRWIQVTSAGNAGWVTRTYVTVLVPDDPDDDGGTELPTAVVGTWDLEWLKDGKSRGFPEDTQGGPTYPSLANSKLH